MCFLPRFTEALGFSVLAYQRAAGGRGEEGREAASGRSYFLLGQGNGAVPPRPPADRARCRSLLLMESSKNLPQSI